MYNYIKQIKLNFNNTLVRPILEYSSSVWHPHHVNRIKEIEKTNVETNYNKDNETTHIEPIREKKNNKEQNSYVSIRDIKLFCHAFPC